MRKVLLALALAFGLTGAAPAPEVELWRLDCGSFRIGDLNAFSDSWAYVGQTRTLTNSCYLVRHGNQYLLWDLGLGLDLIGKPADSNSVFVPGLEEGLLSQLARIGVKPEQVGLIAVSHNHSDHISQAASFPKAKLLIGKKDWEQLTAKDHHPALEPARLQPWIDGAPMELVSGDKDIFGDGSVVMLNMPGHTPDHHALLVRLKNRGAVLLTGDLYHFAEQRAGAGVPPFNFDRGDTLASFDRFNAIARNLSATVIIQHDPADVAKLPIFPKAAD